MKLIVMRRAPGVGWVHGATGQDQIPRERSITLSVEAITAKRSFATNRTELDISRSFLFTTKINLSIFFPIVY
jgi:hypothetical protein